MGRKRQELHVLGNQTKLKSSSNGRAAADHMPFTTFSHSISKLTKKITEEAILFSVFVLFRTCICVSGLLLLVPSLPITILGVNFPFGIYFVPLMLLRNRSRAVSKPGLMADHSSQQSPNQNYAKTIPSLFGSPKFRDFTNKCLSSGTEALRSPTSILDARALSPFAFGNPFSTLPNKICPPNRTSWDKPDSKGIGLALVGALKDDDNPIHDNYEPNKGNVLLRVKIPFESQTCAGDFGTKTKDSKNSSRSGVCAKDDCASPSVRAVSWSEMELSEEYTCVISHGPNPKTTHIFNNCIMVETFYALPQNQNSHSATSANFLSFCHTCKKYLDQTKDIFIYRGEKAFCSRECRHREMVLDGIENLEFESNGFY
ncbi:unnamed protein product [Sphenostylis stenocarpa]|uniref:FLZ-type domain-containing protein n=1 Tax=Sphenostylis stenocarpa TaxID=92480 RepID=A0AA86VBG4_9FABA|nr:unnamed protein product [Sphenostylis stenocarpa]